MHSASEGEESEIDELETDADAPNVVRVHMRSYVYHILIYLLFDAVFRRTPIIYRLQKLRRVPKQLNDVSNVVSGRARKVN